MCAYLLTLHTHLLPHFAGKRAISEEEVQDFVFEKLSGGLSPKTVKDAIALLKSIARHGRKHGACTYGEWDIKYPTDTATRRLQTLNVRHQRMLMRHITDNPTPQNIGILLALCTGMRIGEVCALTWQDIDMKQKVITVKRTVARVYDCESKTTEKLESSPKTKTSCREIPISNLLSRCLRTVRQTSSLHYVVGDMAVPKDPRCYRDYFTRLLKRLGIPKIVFHCLRHTFATRCIESQCDCKTVNSLLGHSNVATTLNLYVHPDLQQKKKCIERMSKLVGFDMK